MTLLPVPSLHRNAVVAGRRACDPAAIEVHTLFAQIGGFTVGQAYWAGRVNLASASTPVSPWGCRGMLND